MGRKFVIDRDELERSIWEDSLHRFVLAAWPHVDPAKFNDGPHIGLLCEYLQAFVAGELPALLLNVPPGHCKSLLVSVFLNAWRWTKYPGDRFMYTSYRGDLALRDADRCRNLIRSEWYQQNWGSKWQLRAGQDTKGRYENSEKGYRYSTSTAGIMGEGGRFVILDDPHNVDEAESNDVRDETVRKINLALPTRIRQADGGVCVIMQRLHESDYAGSMIAERHDLTHVCLPAWYESDHPFVLKPMVTQDRIVSDPDSEEPKVIPGGRKLPGDWRKKDGQLLWPEMFNEERLNTMVAQMKAYGKAGQLQQRPQLREGGMFKRQWFRYIEYSELPKNRNTICRGWDLAASEEPNSAYTAGVRMSYYKGKIYVEHVWRFRATGGKVKKNMQKCAEADGKKTIIDYPQDPGQAGKQQARDMATYFHGYSVKYSPETGEKETRAQAMADQCEAGNVFVVRADWTDAYVEELCAFNTGKFNDQVDASSRAYHRVVRLGSGITSGSLPGAS